MKKFTTLIIFFICSISAFAQNNSSRFSFTALMNGSVVVVIDNRSYQVNDDRTIQVDNIGYGTHSIRVYRQTRNWRRNAIYENNFFVRRGMHLDMIINRFGKVFTDEQPMNALYSENDNWNNNNDNHDWDHHYNDAAQQIMSPVSFGQLKQTLLRESFDNTRLVIAKQAISVNKFSSQQAKELIMLFTYESNKLDIAKNLYANTIDKNNYMIVYDAFTYSTSKEDLARYIQQYR